MQIVNRETFLALEGFVLYREVTTTQAENGIEWALTQGNDGLKVRTGIPVNGSIVELPLTSNDLEDFDLNTRYNSFESQVLPLILLSDVSDTESEYFLIYSKEDVNVIVSALTDCL